MARDSGIRLSGCPMASGFYVYGKEQFLNTIAEVIELHATLKVRHCYLVLRPS